MHARPGKAICTIVCALAYMFSLQVGLMLAQCVLDCARALMLAGGGGRSLRPACPAQLCDRRAAVHLCGLWVRRAGRVAQPCAGRGGAGACGRPGRAAELEVGGGRVALKEAGGTRAGS